MYYPNTIRSHLVTIVPMAPFTLKSTSKLRYPVLTFSNTFIERVTQFNFLCIILHYTLKWQKHIDYLSLKNYQRQSVSCTDLNIYIQK